MLGEKYRRMLQFCGGLTKVIPILYLYYYKNATKSLTYKHILNGHHKNMMLPGSLSWLSQDPSGNNEKDKNISTVAESWYCQFKVKHKEIKQP